MYHISKVLLVIKIYRIIVVFYVQKKYITLHITTINTMKIDGILQVKMFLSYKLYPLLFVIMRLYLGLRPNTAFLRWYCERENEKVDMESNTSTEY